MVFTSRGACLGGLLLCASLAATACSGAKAHSPTAPSPVQAVDPVGGAAPPASPGSPGPTPYAPPPVIGTGTAIMAAVGDIGWCGSAGTAQTARLVAGMDGQVLMPGDLAYMNGSLDDYRRCFDPEWGRFRGRWRPAPGNHEYETPGANGYFDYFGDAAGPRGVGYYGFRAATWHVLMLNSNVSMARGSAQFQWAERELRENRTRCSLAVWHHPYATSGPHGPFSQARDLWELLQQNGVEVVVNGHEHLYERFAPQDPDYRYSPTGIREFVVGTGGASPYHATTRFPNTEAIVEAYGVLKLTLGPTTYDWQFVDTAGQALDRGTETCH